MSGLTTTDPAQLMRIRAEEVLDRGGAGRQAGELAGQFAMMLEQLNGVGDGDAAIAVQPLSGVSGGPVSAEDRGQRLGIGAVSLFAQELAGQEAAGDQPGDMPSFPEYEPFGSSARSAHGQFGDSLNPSGDDAAHQIIQGLLSRDNAQNTDFRWLATLFSSVDGQDGDPPQG